MEYKIQVRTRDGEFADVLDLSGASRGTLHLTTVEDNQTAAEIPVYLASGQAFRHIETLAVEGLEPLSAEECRLDLECVVTRRRLARFMVFQNGRLLLTKTLRLPIPAGRRGLWILAAAAALVILAGLAFLALPLLRGLPPDSRSVPAGYPAPRPPAGTMDEAKPEPVPQLPPAPLPAPRYPVIAAREAFLALGEETLTVYFGPDSAEVKPDQRSKIAEIADLLERYPELDLTISGHCATAGTEKGRLALSQDRASAVYRALGGGGWKPDRAPIVEGYGDSRPATLSGEDQGLNRRVEVRLADQ